MDDIIVQLGLRGFSYRCIGRFSHASKYQIASRLRKAGVRLKTYRDGRNIYAKEVIQKLTLPKIRHRSRVA